MLAPLAMPITRAHMGVSGSITGQCVVRHSPGSVAVHAAHTSVGSDRMPATRHATDVCSLCVFIYVQLAHAPHVMLALLAACPCRGSHLGAIWLRTQGSFTVAPTSVPHGHRPQPCGRTVRNRSARFAPVSCHFLETKRGWLDLGPFPCYFKELG
mgnify:CR=1 FL=1